MIKEKDMFEKLVPRTALAENIKALIHNLTSYISEVREEAIRVAEGQLFRNNVFLFYI